MRLFQSHLAQSMLVVAAGLSLAACSSDEKTALQVDVTLEAGLTPPEKVTFDVSRAGAPYTHQQADWSAASAGKLKVALLLPTAAAGNDTLEVHAFLKDNEIAAASQSITIVAGKTTGPISVVLKSVPIVGQDGGLDALASDGAGPDGGMALDLRMDEPGLDAAVADVPASPSDGAQAIEVALTDAFQMVVDAAETGSPDAPSSLDVAQASDILPAVDTTDAVSASSPVWHPAEYIDMDNLSASASSVAVDPIRGYVYVVWEYVSDVMVKRWNPTTASWEATHTLDHRDYSYSPSIGVDSAGRVIAAWYIDPYQTNDSLSGVWVSHSTDGTSWTPPQRISQGRIVEALALGVARDGTARIAFSRQDTDQNVRVYSDYFDGVAWTEAPDPLAPETDMEDRDPNIAISATGSGVILFSQADAQAKASVAVATFSGKTLDPYILLDANTTDDLSHGVVAMNPNGQAVVVWGDTPGVQLRSYVPSVGWSAPQTISTEVISFYQPSAVMASDGTVTLAWSEWRNGHYQLYSMSGKAGGTWGSPEALENDNHIGTAFDIDHVEATLAVDGSGDVLVAWLKKAVDGSFAVYGRHKHAGVWDPAIMLGRHATLQTERISLAVSDSGLGVASFNWRDPNNTDDPLAYKLLVAMFR